MEKWPFLPLFSEYLPYCRVYMEKGPRMCVPIKEIISVCFRTFHKICWCRRRDENTSFWPRWRGFDPVLDNIGGSEFSMHYPRNYEKLNFVSIRSSNTWISCIQIIRIDVWVDFVGSLKLREILFVLTLVFWCGFLSLHKPTSITISLWSLISSFSLLNN